jgi:hypothetical protein
MIEKHNEVIAVLDAPNHNNRTYTTAAMTEAIAKAALAHPGGVVGRNGIQQGEESSDTLDLNRASHIVSNLRIEDGKVLGTVRTLATADGAVLESLMNQTEMGFRTAGIGMINDVGVVTEFELLYIAAVPVEQSGVDLYTALTQKGQ